MARDIEIYKTHDLDVAAYMMMEGLKFFQTEIDTATKDSYKPRFLLCFFDEKCIARDLEILYAGSQFQKYRSYNKYLLKQIHMTLKGI